MSKRPGAAGNNPHIDGVTQRNIELMARIETAFHNRRTFGDRLADLVTTWVGSWTFVIIQSGLMIAWMGLNLIGWWHRWDPYPFALLNLALSFEAAFSTPIILMSGNRQLRLSERRNHLDLQINLLAEQENTEQLRLLRMICEKMGIPGDGSEQQVLEESIQPDAIVQQIEAIVENDLNPPPA